MSTEQALRETFRRRAEEIGALPELGPRIVAAHRVQRRQRFTVVAAGAVLLLLVVAVVVPLQLWRGSDPVTVAEGAGYPYPPRGSLADEAEFIDAVLRVPWSSELDPPLATRQVVFAGDVPGARWALISGESEGRLVGIWLSGRADAPGEQLTPLSGAVPLDPDAAASSGDFSGPDGPLVIVGRPGDALRVSPAPQIDNGGTVSRRFEPVESRQGVAVLSLPSGGPWVQYQVIRGSRVATTEEVTVNAGPVADTWRDSVIADAAAASLGKPSAETARATVRWLTARTGLDVDDVDLSILWASVDGFPGVLLSATLPSGAVAVVGTCGTPSALSLGMLAFYPAGTDPEEQLFVMSCRPPNGLRDPGFSWFLVLVGPVGTKSFVLTDGGHTVTATGSDRAIFVSDPEGSLSDLQNFRAVDPDGTVLATASVGTVQDFGP